MKADELSALAKLYFPAAKAFRVTVLPSAKAAAAK